MELPLGADEAEEDNFLLARAIVGISTEHRRELPPALGTSHFLLGA